MILILIDCYLYKNCHLYKIVTYIKFLSDYHINFIQTVIYLPGIRSIVVTNKNHDDEYMY